MSSTMYVSSLLVSLFLFVQSSPVALDVSRLTLSAPETVVSFDRGEAHGVPARLTWSPDGRQLHLRIVHRDIWANEKLWHYVVTLAEKRLTPVDREPEWSGVYWLWKSGLECPGLPAFKIEIESRVDRRTATNSGAGGAIAQNSGDPYGPGSDMGPQGQAALQNAQQSQNVATATLRLKGQVLAEFVNTSIQFGLFYGWAPSGVGAMAYANSKRALIIMDGSHRRVEVKGTKGVLLPAWSDDGRSLAWIEQRGGDHFTVKVIRVA
jgi:hypothetical protein